MTYRDGRLPPFAWVSRAAAAVLMEEFDGRERAMALSIYTTLTLLSSEQRRADHDGIVATRKEVAEAAGVSDRTVDAYTDRMVNVGLLVVTRRKKGKLNLPNEWTLVEPAQGGELDSLPTSASQPVAKRVHEGGEPDSTPFKEGEEERRRTTADAVVRRENDPGAIRLCRLLASLMRENDPKSKLPKEGSAARERWLRDMRLLIADRHGDDTEVEFVIRWCQTDSFERANVRSPAKLRQRFSSLLLKAQAQRGQRQHLTAVSDPLAGLSPSARARLQRTADRYHITVEQLLAGQNGHQTNPHPTQSQEALDGHHRTRPQLGAGDHPGGAGASRAPQPAVAGAQCA